MRLYFVFTTRSMLILALSAFVTAVLFLYKFDKQIISEREALVADVALSREVGKETDVGFENSSEKNVFINESISPPINKIGQFENLDIAKIVNEIAADDGSLNLTAGNLVIEKSEFVDFLNALTENSNEADHQLVLVISKKLLSLSNEIPHTSKVNCGSGVCAVQITNIRNSDLTKLEQILPSLSYGAFLYTPIISEGLYGELRLITNTDKDVKTVIWN